MISINVRLICFVGNNLNARKAIPFQEHDKSSLYRFIPVKNKEVKKFKGNSGQVDAIDPTIASWSESMV